MSLFALPQKYYVYAEEGGSAGYYNDAGVWIGATEATGNWKENNFSGTVQPLTDEDIQAMPEGERVTGGVKVYVTNPLPFKTDGGTGAGTETLVLHDGNYYKLHAKGGYSSGIISHYKYIATLYKDTVTVG